MDAVLNILMIFFVLGVGMVIFVGGRSITGNYGSDHPDPETWPLVSVIVPATGTDANMAACFRALLAQDYPEFQVISVTQTPDDPANAIIKPIIHGHPRSRHVQAGLTAGCSQKNHNLLAGLKAIDPRTGVLVFCDSTRIAPVDWLRNLVHPIALGQRPVTTGYHHLIPGDNRLATWGRALTILGLHCLAAFPHLSQTWGGGTAVRRDVFERIDAAGMWAQAVVDDVSLAALLRKFNLPIQYVSGACLSTPYSDDSLGDWNQWLVRQWVYLKFYFPGSWLAGGAFTHLVAAIIILAGMRGLAWLYGWVSWEGGLPALLFLVTVFIMAGLMRWCHPRPGPPAVWLAGALAAIFMASWCHLQTSFTHKVSWRGVCYLVNKNGTVLKVVRSETG